MRHSKAIIAMLVLILLGSGVAFAREIPAVVDVAWLEANLNNPKLVVLDVRKAEDYKAGHIPGAVSVFYGTWAPNKGALSAELPEADDLQDIIADAGISNNSWVVVVESTGLSRYHFATRVAWTLAYAGLDNVAVLASGHDGWIKAGKRVATDVSKKQPSKFTIKPRKEYVTGMDAVVKAMSGGILVDARPYNDYFGLTKPAFVAQFGHVPGAISMPTQWFYETEEKFASKNDIEEAVNTLGLNANQEIIVYCNSGVYATGVWWILHEYLGFPKVTNYDGSAQEISKNPAVKFHKYVWR
jgi:thiosulfate/3-mercaptopyruvate sulfurtransferase